MVEGLVKVRRISSLLVMGLATFALASVAVAQPALRPSPQAPIQSRIQEDFAAPPTPGIPRLAPASQYTRFSLDDTPAGHLRGGIAAYKLGAGEAWSLYYEYSPNGKSGSSPQADDKAQPAEARGDTSTSQDQASDPTAWKIKAEENQAASWESWQAGQGQWPGEGAGVSNPGRWRLPLNVAAVPLASIKPNVQGSVDLRWQKETGPLAAAPMFLTDTQDPESSDGGGFLAMKWNAGPLGVTLGGGYTRAYAATGGAGGGARMMTAGGSGSTSYDSYQRWTAFVAVPYHITQNFGLAPEVSYSYGDQPANMREADNEWLLGLQFKFDF